MNRTLVCIVALAAAIQAQSLIVTRTAPNPIANFDISYIDITGRGAGPTLFQLQLVAPAQPSGSYYIQFTASCQTSVVSGLLIRARSGTFPMPPSYSMTSNEFLTDRGDATPSLHITQESMIPETRQTLLSAGIVPAGRVTLEFELFSVDDPTAPVATASTWFDIVAVRYVKLITPGIEASAQRDDVPESFSVHPQFVWASDLMPVNYPPGSVKFVISLFDNQGGAYTMDNVTDSRPVWEDTIPGESSVNYAQYPVSGARALTPGQTYYWQVKAVLQGPVNREIPSELYAFRVADLDLAGTLSPTQNLILKYLAMILGNNYAHVMHDLRTMSPSEEIMVDGQRVDIEQLAALAEQFVLGQRVVSHVGIK